MTPVMSRSEITLYVSHVWALFVPGHRPHQPNLRGDAPGDLEGWNDDGLELLIEEGRRQLDRLNDELERLRSRAQTLFSVMLAVIGLSISASVIRGVTGAWPLFVTWYLGLLLAVSGMAGAAAVFATTAEMGAVDTVLFSRSSVGASDPSLSRQLALAYPNAVETSSNTIMVRFTLLRDATALSVVGAVLILITWLGVSIAR
jgi:hypothetical protein